MGRELLAVQDQLTFELRQVYDRRRADLVKQQKLTIEQFDQILAGCWLETIEHGPYALGDQNLDWSKVLQGDRFYAMLKIRSVSLGADYASAVSRAYETVAQIRFQGAHARTDIGRKALLISPHVRSTSALRSPSS